MWGNRTRKLETKPAGMVSRDMKPGDSTLTQEGMNERKALERVLVDPLGIEGKPIATSISNDRGPPAMEGKYWRKLHISHASCISKHSVPLVQEEELIANSISEDGNYEATDNNNTDQEETPVSIEYQEWMEEFYIKWMLPHHRDLQRQGCRIYTGQYCA
jgi:hypothetical protein